MPITVITRSAVSYLQTCDMVFTHYLQILPTMKSPTPMPSLLASAARKMPKFANIQRLASGPRSPTAALPMSKWTIHHLLSLSSNPGASRSPLRDRTHRILPIPAPSRPTRPCTPSCRRPARIQRILSLLLQSRPLPRRMPVRSFRRSPPLHGPSSRCGANTKSPQRSSSKAFIRASQRYLRSRQRRVMLPSHRCARIR
jgi:hypothetical protein